MVTRYGFILEAISPVSHGDTLTGIDNATNTRIFMRSGRMVRGRANRVPDISENALRSVMFRRSLHDHLLGALGIEKGTLPQPVTNLLFSGGAMAKGSSAPGDEIALGHQLRNLYPSLELLGGAVDSFILPRSRLSLVALPIADEYRDSLEQIAPEVAPMATESVFDMVTDEVRTRGTGSESDGNQMLYGYETLAAGAKIYVELTLDAWTSEACKSSVAVAVSNWDGYFGGQARQGRGRMTVAWLNGPTPDAYLEHLDSYGKAMKDGLITGQFGTAKILCR